MVGFLFDFINFHYYIYNKIKMKGNLFKTKLGEWKVSYQELKRNIDPNDVVIHETEFIEKEVLLHPKHKDGAIIDKEIEFEIIKVNDHYYHSSPQYTDYAVIIQNKEEKQKELYIKIEHAIITWSLDGTKTAGFLTRQILDLVND